VAAGLAGPAVGQALARIRAAYLDGALRSREEALALARELAARRPAPARRAARAGRRAARAVAEPKAIGDTASASPEPSPRRPTAPERR
jgi:hypothetical protein